MVLIRSWCWRRAGYCGQILWLVALREGASTPAPGGAHVLLLEPLHQVRRVPAVRAAEAKHGLTPHHHLADNAAEGHGPAGEAHAPHGVHLATVRLAHAAADGDLQLGRL